MIETLDRTTGLALEAGPPGISGFFPWVDRVGRRELMLRALAATPGGTLFFGAQSQNVGFFEKLGCEAGPSGIVMRHAVRARSS